MGKRERPMTRVHFSRVVISFRARPRVKEGVSLRHVPTPTEDSVRWGVSDLMTSDFGSIPAGGHFVVRAFPGF